MDEDCDNYDDYIDFYGTGGEANGSAEEDNSRTHMEEDDDMLENLPKEIYCDIVETLEDKCAEFSLLEIWKYERNVISDLAQQDIIN